MLHYHLNEQSLCQRAWSDATLAKNEFTLVKFISSSADKQANTFMKSSVGRLQRHPAAAGLSPSGRGVTSAGTASVAAPKEMVCR